MINNTTIGSSVSRISFRGGGGGGGVQFATRLLGGTGACSPRKFLKIVQFGAF